MGLLCKGLLGASRHPHYVIRTSPLCGVKVLPARLCFSLTASRGDRRKKKNVPWLPSLRSERSVVQRRRQPTPTQLIFLYARYIIYGETQTKALF